MALQGALGETLESLRQEDDVRLGDSLEHELVPAVENLHEEINQWRADLEWTPGSEGRT